MNMMPIYYSTIKIKYNYFIVYIISLIILYYIIVEETDTHSGYLIFSNSSNNLALCDP